MIMISWPSTFFPRKNCRVKLKSICILHSFATIDARLTYLWSWPNFFLRKHHGKQWVQIHSEETFLFTYLCFHDIFKNQRVYFKTSTQLCHLYTGKFLPDLKKVHGSFIHKLHWRFLHFWPPTHLTLVKEFTVIRGKHAFHWHFQYLLHTSSCQHSL